MEDLEFTNKNLPNIPDIMEMFIKLDQKGIIIEDLDKMREDFMAMSQVTSKEYDKFVKNMFDKGLTAVIDNLQEFTLCIGTLVGLGEAISDKLEMKTYIELTKSGLGTDNTKKMAQGDRDKFAKFEVAGIDGMVETLKNTLSNARNRLSSYTEKKKW